jgi:hypothetical protein
MRTSEAKKWLFIKLLIFLPVKRLERVILQGENLLPSNLRGCKGGKKYF